jgi:hypothetical protein
VFPVGEKRLLAAVCFDDTTVTAWAPLTNVVGKGKQTAGDWDSELASGCEVWQPHLQASELYAELLNASLTSIGGFQRQPHQQQRGVRLIMQIAFRRTAHGGVDTTLLRRWRDRQRDDVSRVDSSVDGAKRTAVELRTTTSY